MYDVIDHEKHLSFLAKVSLVLFFFLAVVFWSPVFPGLFSIPTAYLYLPLMLLLCCALYLWKGMTSNELFIFLILLLSVLFFSVITQSTTNFNRFIFIPFCFYICVRLARERKFIEIFCDWLTVFCIVAIVLAWISFFYVLAGGEQQLEFSNHDGRPNRLYLTSLSNAVIDGVIRTAFIYDEPGAFSFVLVVAVIIREMLAKNRMLSLLILLGGLVTFSLIHVMVLAIYVFLVLNFKFKVISALAFMFVVSVTYGDPRFGFFYDRFDSDGDNAGLSNRTVQLENFYNVIADDPEVFFFGDYNCHVREEKRCYEHGDISSSPVTPTYLGGIFLFMIQALTHLALFFAMLRKRFFFPAVAMTLLLLQRPYFHLLGYQMLIFFPVFYMLYDASFLKRRFS
ncbi:hypothetical protein [Ectopseudomonas oleovorans]|uniref:hypothetical protein n=1 Tax=Ectopseudomonas oleovorans TaxID=301 RepID=UPI00241D0293|nr:hypothetical protein [Pseudomonas oleovorans]